MFYDTLTRLFSSRQDSWGVVVSMLTSVDTTATQHTDVIITVSQLLLLQHCCGFLGQFFLKCGNILHSAPLS